MHEREKFDNEWAISEIPEPLSNTGGGEGGRRGGVRRLYFVRKLKKGEKFRRENKDWCINLQFFFFSEKTAEKVKEMATVIYFFIIPCDKN